MYWFILLCYDQDYDSKIKGTLSNCVNTLIYGSLQSSPVRAGAQIESWTHDDPGATHFTKGPFKGRRIILSIFNNLNTTIKKDILQKMTKGRQQPKMGNLNSSMMSTIENDEVYERIGDMELTIIGLREALEDVRWKY